MPKNVLREKSDIWRCEQPYMNLYVRFITNIHTIKLFTLYDKSTILFITWLNCHQNSLYLTSYTPDITSIALKRVHKIATTRSANTAFLSMRYLEVSFPLLDGLTGFPQATTLLGHMDSEPTHTLCADDPEDICA